MVGKANVNIYIKHHTFLQKHSNSQKGCVFRKPQVGLKSFYEKYFQRCEHISRIYNADEKTFSHLLFFVPFLYWDFIQKNFFSSLIKSPNTNILASIRL